MEIKPRVLFDRRLPSTPKVSLILLDWSVRESFHIFDYLAKQDAPRDQFEVLWIEYFDRAAPDIAQRIDEAERRSEVPPVDRWIVLNMPRTAYYHKHLMYNLGIIASRGELVMIGDSDAMVTPRFVKTLIDSFEQDQGIALHLDEVRNHNRSFYPFNYPTFDQVLGEGCANWRDGTTTGLADEFDPLHSRNYGACFCARRDDVIAIGGADEHLGYLGHICGPYDFTWRLVNSGSREVWHPSEFLYHVWHPGTDGEDNYMGPHDGRQLSSLSLQARRTGRVMPLVENAVIRALRLGEQPQTALEDTLRRGIGDRPFTEWIIDDVKRAVSTGRTALAQHRYQAALDAWRPVLDAMSDDPFFLNDLGWAHYHLGSHQAAGDAFGQSLAIDDHNPDAWRGRGWVLTNSGDTSAAVEAFTRAIDLADRVVRGPLQEAHRGRAWAYLSDGQLERAHEDFKSARALTAVDDNGSLQDVNRGLGWVMLRQGRAGDAQLYFSEVIRALGKRRGSEYENARAGLEKADAKVEFLVRKATRKPKAGKRAAREAAPDADGAPGSNRSARVGSRLAAELADAYYGARRYEEALSRFAEALRIDPTNCRAMCGMAWTQLQLGRLEDARATFERTVHADGAEPATLRHAFHGRGWLAYRQGRQRDAVKDFTRALRVKTPRRHQGDRREIEEIQRGLRRARYLARIGDVTLRDIANHEHESLLRIAVDMQRRALQGRIVSWRLGRVRQ